MPSSDGTSGFQGENVVGSVLDQVVIFHGDTLPAGTNDIPQGGLFLLEQIDGIYGKGVYEQTNATKATPTWVLRISIGNSGDQVYPLSVTIGDYSAPTAAVATSSTATLPAGLMAYWQFEEASGKFLNGAKAVNSPDNLGTAVDATNTGADYQATGKLGAGPYAATFVRANNDYATIDTPIAFGSTDFTIAAWIKPTTASTNSGFYLFGGRNAGAIRLIIYYNPFNDTVEAQVSDGTNSVTVNSTAVDINDGNWHFVALVRDGTTWRLYIDGAQRDSDVGTPSAVGDPNPTVQIIGNSAAAAAFSLGGELDDMAIWNRALSATEINTTLYNAGTGALASSIVSACNANRVFDNKTLSFWQSNSETNPAIYVDTGSAQDLVAIVVMLDLDVTTETQIKVRTSTDATFTDAETIRLINIADFTDETYRYIVIPRQVEDRRYVQIYGVGTSKVLKIHEIKYRARTNAQVDREHFHHYLSPTNANENVLDSN